MIQVRVAQQSAVSVRITGTAVVSAPEYAGPYDITPLLSAQTLPTAKRLLQQHLGRAIRGRGPHTASLFALHILYHISSLFHNMRMNS